MKRQKTKAIAARCQRAKRRINLSNEKEENYESDTRDETDLDQAGDDKNSLQL